MTKLLKAIVITFFSLVLLFVVAVTLLVTFVHPNDFKDQISQFVHDQTDRTLTIKGDISWSFFPWLGVQVNDVSLSNAPGFGDKPFAKVGEMDASIRLLPLIAGRVQLGRLVLNDLTVNLVKNKRGQTNWSDLQDEQTKNQKQPALPAKAEDTHKKPTVSKRRHRPMTFSVSSIAVTNANISWDNQQTGQQAKIKNLNITSKGFNFGDSIDLNVAFSIELKNPNASGQFDASGAVSIDPDKQKYAFKNLAVKTQLESKKLPRGKLDLSFKTDAALDLKKGSLLLDDIEIKLNKSDLEGDIHITDFERKTLTFDLSSNNFDLRSLVIPTDKRPTPKTKSLPSRSSARAAPAPTWNINGKLRIKRLRALKLRMSNFTVGVNSKNNITKLAPLDAALYSGRTKGQVVIDTRRQTPRFTVVEALSGVQVEPLLVDLVGPKDALLAGTANINVNVTAAGTETDAITRSLNGKARFSVTNGALKGVDLNYQLKRITISLLHIPFTKKAKSTNRTPFNSLSGSFAIRNGLARNNDLLLKSPLVDVQGHGTANFVTEHLDFRIRIIAKSKDFGKDVFKLQDQLGGSVAVKITGPFSSPNVYPDMSIIPKALLKGLLIDPPSQIIDIGKGVTKDVGKIIKGIFGN